MEYTKIDDDPCMCGCHSPGPGFSMLHFRDCCCSCIGCGTHRIKDENWESHKENCQGWKDYTLNQLFREHLAKHPEEVEYDFSRFVWLDCNHPFKELLKITNTFNDQIAIVISHGRLRDQIPGAGQHNYIDVLSLEVEEDGESCSLNLRKEDAAKLWPILKSYAEGIMDPPRQIGHVGRL